MSFLCAAPLIFDLASPLPLSQRLIPPALLPVQLLLPVSRLVAASAAAALAVPVAVLAAAIAGQEPACLFALTACLRVRSRRVPDSRVAE